MARNIKYEIEHLQVEEDNLSKLQKQFLRPTFIVDDTNEKISSLTATINNKIVELKKTCEMLELDSSENEDCKIIIQNLQFSLKEKLNKFSFKHNIAQQTFSASVQKNIAQHESNDTTIENYDFTLADNVDQERITLHDDEQEIEELARRAAVVHDLFAELGNIIAMHSELTDRIDFCIETALNNAVVAHNDIVKAASYQKKSRMWICAIVLLVLVIILLIFAILK
ncbi:syntaxin-16 isoform X10 [Histomonas meleagridis]|uniref:syntaxin-16 isoform X10 n=1 Tax=Histomonas meleagridis TaxID=135588 RepID=UPI003559DA5A|nr:syntaxin-16 isoform X10 [Histomonas meleagridis]KAH0796478.1 syntaxin-16 isoform X10 [Histomonas meleagridis]